MSERYPYQETYVSNRELLCNTLGCDMPYLNCEEKESLYLYRHLVKKIADEREEIQWLMEQKGMEASIKECENNIVRYNVQLSKMESEYPLRQLIQDLRRKEQAREIKASQVKQVPQEVQEKKTDKPKKVSNIKTKKLINALNKLHYEGVFTALTYIFTFLWFGYLVNVVATSDSHIIGKIFFIAWSLVLAFLFVIHKFGGSDDD